MKESLVLADGYLRIVLDSEIKINLKKPTVFLTQSKMTSSWTGVFWHNGKMFSSNVANEKVSLVGTYSFQILNSNAVTLLRINEIQNVYLEKAY